MDPNQEDPPAEPVEPAAPSNPGPGGDRVNAGPEAAEATLERRRSADALGGATHAGLLRWCAIALVGSLVAIVSRRPDAMVFLALALMFALARSWDTRDRARTGDPASDDALLPGVVGTVLRGLVPAVGPLAGAALFVILAMFAWTLPHTVARIAAMQWSIAAAAVCASLVIPAFARQVARAFLPEPHPGHTARLTASIALVLLLSPVATGLLFGDLIGYLTQTNQPVSDIGLLLGQMVGEVLIALAAVGLWVGRDWRATRERLGLGGITLRHAIIAAVGLAAVLGVNTGMEWVERVYFHRLWLADQAMTEEIAGKLSIAAALALGLSAGVGEEILVRGALQPRSGLVWASLLFACAHLQYTWFGMLTVFGLGLTLGWVKWRANTTTAILVHMLYDSIAVLGMR